MALRSADEREICTLFCLKVRHVDSAGILAMIGHKGEIMFYVLSRILIVSMLLCAHALFAADRVVVCEMIIEET